MRVVIIAALAMVVPGLAQTALADSSIETIVTSRGDTPSVVAITCTTCEPLQDKRVVPFDTGPKLAKGTQKIEVRTVNGKSELVRTEAWLGGSPIVFVNKQAGWLDNGSQLAGLTTDGIDTATATAAVDRTMPVQDDMNLRLK